MLDREYHIKTLNDCIAIPLSSQFGSDDLDAIRTKVSDAMLGIDEFHPKDKRYEKLEQLVSDRLPADLASQIPKSLDLVGDIAVVDLSSDLVPFEKEIAEGILTLQPSAKAVFARAGSVSGVERVRPLRYIAGENRTTTVHKEFGCAFKIDLSKVFFSPRLSTEHQRVASQVGEGETVLDMFAGVGPFSILIAKNVMNVKVEAIDINPEAARLLTDNVRLNKVDSKVRVHLGNAIEVTRTKLRQKVDRVIMNHPSSASKFVSSGCDALNRSTGTIHYYTFADGDEAEQRASQEFTKAVEESDHKVKDIVQVRKVREVGPMKWQIAIDARVSP